MSSETRIIFEDHQGSFESNTKDGKVTQKFSKAGEEKTVLFEDGDAEIQVERTTAVEESKKGPHRWKKWESIPRYDPFCCPMGNRNLRTCCIVIGIMEVVLCIILIVYLTFTNFKISDTADIVDQEYKDEIEWKNNILLLEQIMWSILCSFVAVGGMLLVAAAIKRIKILCLIHSITATICFIVTFINLILYTVYYAHEGANFATVVAFFVILSLALNFPYFAACSLGLYTQLRDGNTFQSTEEEAVDVDASELEDAETMRTESHSHRKKHKPLQLPRRSIMERGDFVNRPSVHI